MQELLSFQDNLLKQTQADWFRYLYYQLPIAEKMIGIKGLRGVGKTTLLLQYLKYEWKNPETALYVTADHPYFYQNSLFELAGEWERWGGALLLIDEVHKYANWSRELKLIYDGFPQLKVIFTSSSALDLYRGESDLSRRLITRTLNGLSFREYLSLHKIIEHPAVYLPDVLQNHKNISREINNSIKILPHFKDYITSGYFPFSKPGHNEFINQKLIQVINTVLETDLAHVQDYSATNIAKIKKLLGVIAASAPFEPNISKIAQKLNLGRETVNHYLRHLQDAYILNLTNKPAKGIAALQKPDKIYIENTAFVHALQPQPEVGTLRETFFVNQLRNGGYEVALGTKGDFIVNSLYTFEIGGRNKDMSQISGLENAYLALDNIEGGIGPRIPLWLFGFLY